MTDCKTATNLSQEGALCALDVLSASGLINYFGRMELPGQSTTDEDATEDGLKVKPVLLQKGSTKLALYGMGNIRDDRFMYEMSNRRINLYRPKGEQEEDEWFNIMLVHQNRLVCFSLCSLFLGNAVLNSPPFLCLVSLEDRTTQYLMKRLEMKSTWSFGVTNTIVSLKLDPYQ